MSQKTNPTHTEAAVAKSVLVKINAKQYEQVRGLARQTGRTAISLYTELLEFGLACRAPIIQQRWDEDRRALAPKN